MSVKALNLLCLNDKNPNHICEFKFNGSTVTALKKRIKLEMAPQFDHLPASHLTLWKCSISIFGGWLEGELDFLQDNMKTFDGDLTLLEPGMPLSHYFKDGDELDPGYIHIIVQGIGSDLTSTISYQISKIPPAVVSTFASGISLAVFGLGIWALFKGYKSQSLKEWVLSAFNLG